MSLSCITPTICGSLYVGVDTLYFTGASAMTIEDTAACGTAVHQSTNRELMFHRHGLKNELTQALLTLSSDSLQPVLVQASVSAGISRPPHETQ
jgi:hypothetical protein